MKTNLVMYLCLLVTLLFIQFDANAQDAKVGDTKNAIKKKSTKPSDPTDSIYLYKNDTSPYDPKTRLQFKLAYFDRLSVGIQWDREMERSDLSSEKPPTEGEVLSRLMKLNTTEQKQVNELFAARKSAHDRNTAILRRISNEENDDYLNAAGVRGPINPEEERLNASPEDTEKLLRDYLEKEYEAEMTLAMALKDAIDPLAYKILVDRWIYYDNIGNPLMTTYLEMTDEQIVQVREACRDFKKLNDRLEREASSQESDGKHSGAPAQKQEWWDARFKMYTYLTPQQFKQVAHLLFNERDSSPGFFRKRLNIAKARAEKFNVPIATAEYRALGDLYRKGISEVESANPYQQRV